MTRAPYPATATDIQKSIPWSFDDIIGNQNLVSYFADGLKSNGMVASTLLIGPSRTGKTAIIKVFVSTLLCENTGTLARGPCHACKHCTDDVARYGQTGIYSQTRTDPKMIDRPIHYMALDCSLLTESLFREQLVELRDYQGLRLVYLDEIHRLARRGLDEMLLKAMDERNFVWLASSTTIGDLDQALLNRFLVRLNTEKPTLKEMVVWLFARCQEWQLTVDHDDTLITLAQRSNFIPGLALRLLAWAAMTSDRRLTKEMVDSQTLDAI